MLFGKTPGWGSTSRSNHHPAYKVRLCTWGVPACLLNLFPLLPFSTPELYFLWLHSDPAHSEWSSIYGRESLWLCLCCHYGTHLEYHLDCAPHHRHKIFWDRLPTLHGMCPRSTLRHSHYFVLLSHLKHQNQQKGFSYSKATKAGCCPPYLYLREGMRLLWCSLSYT